MNTMMVLIVRSVLLFFVIYFLDRIFFVVWTYPSGSAFDPIFWKARWSYYATLGIVFSSLIGLFGVFLGLFYYFHKLRYEREQKQRADHQQNLKLILDKLNTFDELLMRFFYLDTAASAQFNKIKSEIATSFDDIYSLLENPAARISNDEMRIIMAVNQFVDTHELMTAQTYEGFILLQPTNSVVEFRRLLANSKNCCYKCLFDVRVT